MYFSTVPVTRCKLTIYPARDWYKPVGENNYAHDKLLENHIAV